MNAILQIFYPPCTSATLNHGKAAPVYTIEDIKPAGHRGSMMYDIQSAGLIVFLLMLALLLLRPASANMQLGIDLDGSTPGFQTDITVPAGTNFVARVKLAENNSATPVDRVFFNYTYFNNAFPAPPPVPTPDPLLLLSGGPFAGDIASFGSFPGIPNSFTATVDRIANPSTAISEGASLMVQETATLLAPFTDQVGSIHLGTIADVGAWDFDNVNPSPDEITIMTVTFEALAAGTLTMALLTPEGGSHLTNNGQVVAVDLLNASVTISGAIPLPPGGILLGSALVTIFASRRKRADQQKAGSDTTFRLHAVFR